jgi:hypothetical protein
VCLKLHFQSNFESLFYIFITFYSSNSEHMNVLIIHTALITVRIHHFSIKIQVFQKVRFVPVVRNFIIFIKKCFISLIIACFQICN